MSDNKKPKKGTRKVLPQYLSVETLQELLSTPYKTNYRDRLILSLMAKCGLRVGEVVKLTYNDFKLDISKISVCGKGDKERMVPLHDDIRRLFSSYIEREDITHGKLFPTSVQGISAILRKYAKESGLLKKVTTRNDGKPMYNIHPHILRHSFAVHSLMSGINIRNLQRTMGHARLDTTVIYLELTDEDIVDDYKKHPLPY